MNDEVQTTTVYEELRVGDKIRTLTSIWDDGADHHPPCYLAMSGEILVVRKVSDKWLCVSHEDVTDSSFCVHPGEWERIPHSPINAASTERK